MSEGRNCEALDLADLALASSPRDVELIHLAALACARVGAQSEALDRLSRIREDDARDVRLRAEIVALRGRLAKDSGRLEEALAEYRRAHELHPSHYAAVNAATVAYRLGLESLSMSLAKEALDLSPRDGGAWEHASRGEALLLLGRVAQARDAYEAASRLAGERAGDVSSMRKQLRFIGSGAALELLSAVPAPRVIAFSGHMIDAPDRPGRRFPPEAETEVAQRLKGTLRDLLPAVGYSQAACGADILFLEAMQELRCETHVVLPFARTDFVRESVAFAGERWIERFDRALNAATSVTFATEEPYLADEILFEHASNLIQGMSIVRARELESVPMMLTVMQPELAGAAIGGTWFNARAWTERGFEHINIPIDAGGRKANAGPVRTGARVGHGRKLKSILFADVTGFSRMPEEYSPRFAEVFLGASKHALDSLAIAPADANTRGDGLYMVFDHPAQAADFALELRDEIGRIAWRELGLSESTHARIGIHVGPVFETDDPIMAKKTFNGSHVNRAARLEPVVRPGQVFVTHAFAATLALIPGGKYRCDYIGIVALAKGFGDAHLYRIESDAHG